MTEEQFDQLKELAKAAAIAIQERQKKQGERFDVARLAKEITSFDD